MSAVAVSRVMVRVALEMAPSRASARTVTAFAPRSSGIAGMVHWVRPSACPVPVVLFQRMRRRPWVLDAVPLTRMVAALVRSLFVGASTRISGVEGVGAEVVPRLTVRFSIAWAFAASVAVSVNWLAPASSGTLRMDQRRAESASMTPEPPRLLAH